MSTLTLTTVKTNLVALAVAISVSGLFLAATIS